MSPPDLNAELSDRLNSCRLVFEVLDEATCGAIDAAVDWLKERNPHLPALLADRYPALLTCHLVAEGIERYTAGAFWSGLRFTCAQNEQAMMGEAFLRTLRAHGLETFDFLRERGLRFVTPILAHAGMPRYCLEDFFFKLLARELRKGFGGSAPELLATWRARKTAFVGIDRPVERFLLFGGETAVDLLDRCIDLLADTARTDCVPDAASLGLPRHLVEVFAKGWTSDGRRSISFSSGRVGVPAPSVRIDPWDPLGPILELPVVPQSLASESWTVESGMGVDSWRASVLQVQQRRLLPARNWSVSLSRPRDTPRTFVFEWLAETGVAAFDPSTGLLARDSRVIAWARAWLLHPADTTLAARGRAGGAVPLSSAQELPAPVGAWTGYVLAEYDLEGIAFISARRGGCAGPVEETVRVLHATAGRPLLEGTPVDDVRTDTGLAVYSTPPTLRFPASVARAWRVRLRIVDSTIERTFEGQGELPLAELLAEVDVAYVDVLATGPIGMDLRTSFALVRGLSVRRPPRLVLPAEPAWVELSAEPGVRLSSGNGRVLLPAGADSVSCEAADKTGRVNLITSVPRLVWAVTRPSAAAAQRFDTKIERVGLDELGGTGSWGGALSVSTRCPGLRLRLELFAPDGASLQRSDVERASARDGRALFHLAPFRDTALASGASSLRLVLWLVDLPASVEVGQLHARINLTHLQATHVPMLDGSSAFDLEFEETVRFRRREMRLWSRGRPWETSPVTRIGIPDEATQRVLLRAPVDTSFPPGRYLAEIDIRDDWTSPVRPHRRARNTTTVVVGGPTSHRAQLLVRASEDPLAVVELLLEEGVLHRQLLPEEVASTGEQIVVTLVSLRSGDVRDERARDVLLEMLRAQPAVAARAVATRRESMSTSEALKLAVRLLPLHTMSADGKWDESARECWNACAPLAAQIDVGLALGGSEEAGARCREFLGWDVGHWPVSESAPTASEFAPQQALLGLDVAFLAGVRQACVLVPTALLTRDEYADLGFEWLAERERAQQWLEDFRDLSSAPDMARMTPAEHLYIDSREPQTGTVELARFPQWTLVAGLLLARPHIGDPELTILARRALVAAASFAPRLVAFDVALASVMTRWQPTESACSTP